MDLFDIHISYRLLDIGYNYHRHNLFYPCAIAALLLLKNNGIAANITNELAKNRQR